MRVALNHTDFTVDPAEDGSYTFQSLSEIAKIQLTLNYIKPDKAIRELQ